MHCICYNAGMSEALYRKYRPKTFDDVIGQEHIVSVLESAIQKGDIAHAYIFAGTRGTGKTSIARIVAREIGTSENDVYEIDAASNRGIDDVRAIRESVHTLPFESKYKVYIIDEAHMLTKEAWNAFLKTLEEPPSYVIFMMATTELEKIPDTVLSRCVAFQFKKPSRTALRDMVQKVAKSEGVTLDKSSAELIALLGDGSFRDTQGILQKVLSFSKDKMISFEEVSMVTGAPRQELVQQFTESIVYKDAKRAFEIVKEVNEKGIDVALFLTLILEWLRAILILRVTPDAKSWLTEAFSEDDFATLQKMAGDNGAHLTSETIKELLVAYGEIGKSFIATLPLELALARIFTPEEKLV
jgi:DNA polymerase III subunit gamma/tau